MDMSPIERTERLVRIFHGVAIFICAVITQIAIFLFVREMYMSKPYTTIELYQASAVVFAYASIIFGMVLAFLADPKYLFYGGFLSLFMYKWMAPSLIEWYATRWYGMFGSYPAIHWFYLGMIIMFFYFIGGYERLIKKYLG